MNLLVTLLVLNLAISSPNKSCSGTNDSCFYEHITFFESSNQIRSQELTYTFDFLFKEIECSRIKKEYCFNSVIFIDSISQQYVYTRSYPNYYHENGQIKRELRFIDSTFTKMCYNHYDLRGNLIGQEFFIHHYEKRHFFDFVGIWWKMINGKIVFVDIENVKRDKIYLYDNEEYFDY